MITTEQAAQFYRNLNLPVPEDLRPTSEVLKEKLSKMGNVKKEINGITFASGLEAQAFQVLSLWWSLGRIADLILQPEFVLQQGFRDAKLGRHFSSVRYIADFQFRYAGSGLTTVVDAKGQRTKAFIDKEKQFRAKYPHLSFEVWDKAKIRELSGH